MLFRVSGNLANGKTFAARADESNAIAATARVRKLLNDNGVTDDSVVKLVASPVRASGDKIHIGEARKSNAAKQETSGTAAKKR